jgi:hypothetical protein
VVSVHGDIFGLPRKHLVWSSQFVPLLFVFTNHEHFFAMVIPPTPGLAEATQMAAADFINFVKHRCCLACSLLQ